MKPTTTQPTVVPAESAQRGDDAASAEAASAAEASLVARLRQGDGAAYEELVRSAGGRMLAVARSMLSTEEDAHDAVQEAFLSAFKALAAFDGRARLTTWLHRITVNACLMRLRSQRRKPERRMTDLLPKFVDDGHQLNPSAPWDRHEPDALSREETRQLVCAKIAELPTPYRIVLTLRELQGLDTAAVAEILGTSRNVVKIRLHRARLALKALLDTELG